MGIKIPNGSGGFKDVTALKRHNGSAWVECEFARVYQNGAWVDKWVNAKPFYIIQNNTLVNPAKMGGWLRNNFYAYANNVSMNGGNLGYTAQADNNGNVNFATAASNIVANIYPWDVNPVPFNLEKCNKCRVVIDAIGPAKSGGITITIGGIQVPHNHQVGTYIIDLGAATTSYIGVNIVAYATNTNYVYIKEVYFYKG